MEKFFRRDEDMQTSTPIDCPLCSHSAMPMVADRVRLYFHCPHCDLVFADPASRLDAAAEKAVYDLHENDPADARYRRFLNRLADPLLTRLTPGMRGLDYGCGPGPTLSLMLEEAGMRMANYDPYYFPRPWLLDAEYDFLTCTETAEHFCRPARDWARLTALLRPGGWLGLMTKLRIEERDFLAWHYKIDPTHVSFYSALTLAWLGERFGFTVERIGGDVALMQKKGDAGPLVSA